MSYIKYRAYDIDTKLMSLPFTIGENIVKFKGGKVQCHLNLWTNEFKVMQYTGLKDKNGVEICVGDILGFNTGVGRGFMTDNKDVILPPVQFGEFYAKDVDLYKFIGFHIDSCSIHYKLSHGCEIKGNIYENPELLTA